MQTINYLIKKRAYSPRLLAISFILLGIAVISLAGRDVLSGLADNLAAIFFAREMPEIQPTNGLPMCRQQMSLSRASRWVETTAKLNSERLATRLNDARLAWLLGDCKESNRVYSEILTAFPDDYRAAYWLYWLDDANHDPSYFGLSRQELAGFARKLGNQADQLLSIDGTLAWYRLSFRLAPDQSLAYQISSLYHRAGKIDQLLNFLIEIQGRYSEQTPEYWWAAGEIASQKSDWHMAVQAYQHATSLAVDPYDYLIEQAIALQYLGDLAGEEQAYLDAIKSHPESYYPYIGLGQIYRRSGDFDAALSFYQQAETLAPHDFLPQYVIGELYYENNQYDQARPYLESASQLNPKDVYSYYFLAQIYRQTGDFYLAINTLNQAISVSTGDHPEWLIQLGDLYLEVGDLVHALQIYLQAVEGGVTDPGLQEKIVRLRSQINPP